VLIISRRLFQGPIALCAKKYSRIHQLYLQWLCDLACMRGRLGLCDVPSIFTTVYEGLLVVLLGGAGSLRSHCAVVWRATVEVRGVVAGTVKPDVVFERRLAVTCLALRVAVCNDVPKTEMFFLLSWHWGNSLSSFPSPLSFPFRPLRNRPLPFPPSPYK